MDPNLCFVLLKWFSGRQSLSQQEAVGLLSCVSLERGIENYQSIRVSTAIVLRIAGRIWRKCSVMLQR